MKKGILWLGLSLLLVASLVLSSCAKTTTPTTVTQTATTTATTTQTATTTTTATTQTTTATTTAALGTPKYGGVLNVIGYRTAQAPTSWDYALSAFANTYWTTPYQEYLLASDIDGLGPRGTNAFNFQVQEGTPQQYLTGELATSFEQPDPLTLIFHIRKNVMWAPNANIGFATRALTADDIAYSFNRWWNGPYGGATIGYVASITATNSSTVVIKFKVYSADWVYHLGYGFMSTVTTPETVKAGAADWRNQTGTGPFILTDYVSGSYARYDRNPNYWGTTTINGKSYQTPFIDTLIYPVITDVSTQISAIRTGKIDLSWGVSMTYKATLNSSSPKMETFTYLKNNILCLGFMTTSGKYSDVKVRQAMMIGTDLKKIASAVYPGGAEYVAYPLGPGVAAFTPLAQMPADIQALFNYDPVKAKQMLADAGYPNGFPTEIVIDGTKSEYNDIGALLVDQWAKMGVTVTLKPMDVAGWSGVMVNHTYTDCFISSTGNGIQASHLNMKTVPGAANTANWVDATVQAMDTKAGATMDLTAQTALYAQENLYILQQCPWIGFAAPYIIGCRWPWVKNYYYEVEGGDLNYIPMIRDIWLDQSLKQQIGY
jgi:peptide/nickel transport system substrate-binding protein